MALRDKLHNSCSNIVQCIFYTYQNSMYKAFEAIVMYNVSLNFSHPLDVVYKSMVHCLGGLLLIIKIPLFFDMFFFLKQNTVTQ